MTTLNNTSVKSTDVEIKKQNEIILNEININDKIEQNINQVGQSAKAKKTNHLCVDDSDYDSEYEYSYNVVIIGAAGATLELVKTKKVKVETLYNKQVETSIYKKIDILNKSI